MSDIVKASSLIGPVIQGKVSINLSELDQMRADHAQAIKVAQELEDRIAQVKLTVVRKERGASKYDHYNNFIGYHPDTYQEIDVQWKGFDDFREVIVKEERAKVEEVINNLHTETQRAINSANESNLARIKAEEDVASTKETCDLAIKKANDRIVDIKALQPELNEKYEALLKRNDQLVSDVMKAEKYLNDSKAEREREHGETLLLKEELYSLRRQVYELKRKKSFFFWLTSTAEEWKEIK